MEVAGLIFKPHPSNVVRIHFLPSCKNAKRFFMISKVVSDLAKISVSVPSISWGVLGKWHSRLKIRLHFWKCNTRNLIRGQETRAKSLGKTRFI